MKKTFLEETDEIYCINLFKRPEKWENFKKDSYPHFKKSITQWLGVDGNLLTEEELSKFNFRTIKSKNRGHAGCSLSHKGIYENALNKGHKRILVLEDDCFVSEPLTFLEDIEKAAKELPDDWFIFYIGGHEWNINKSIPMIEPYSEHLVKAMQVFETHAYFINIESIKFILDLFKLDPREIDDMHVYLQQKLRRSFFTNPVLCSQRPCFSDICNREVSNHGTKGYMKKRQLTIKKTEQKNLF